MLQFVVLTVVFFFALLILYGWGKRREVMENWPKYRASPLYMTTAFLYKPDNDPRSRLQFTEDNFKYLIQFILVETLRAVLSPIFDIFQVTGGGIQGGAAGVGSIQNIMTTMLKSFDGIFSIFENRYKAVLYRLSATFRALQNSMSRLWAASVSSIYMSMSNVAAMLSALDLIIKIVIIILVILVAIVFFLFLFMWPFVPVILSVIGILVTAGAGAAVGGMATTFCFAANTPVLMADGTTKPIQDVKVGDALGGACGNVSAHLEFLQVCKDMYVLDGIHVTGSHIVWLDGRPMPVSAHPRATPSTTTPTTQPIALYCLNTTSQRIPIAGTVAPLIFSDWEELGEAEETQMEWNRRVFERLNPGAKWDPTVAAAAIESEAGLHPATLILCPKQELVEICKIRPGMMVLDEEEKPTRVLGVVEIAGSQILKMGSPMSIATWSRTSARAPWKQVAADHGNHQIPTVSPSSAWYSLITESGTFRILHGGAAVRDFTDVGIYELPATYEWVLEVLGNN